MNDNAGFNHITVSADDDDDVVIQAGIVDEDAEDGDVEGGEALTASEGEGIEGAVAAGEGAEGGAAEAADAGADAAEAAAPASAADTSEPAADTAAPAADASGEARPVPAPDDGYRETTLDDIESSKMPTAQKAVIVVALLGIVAFILWYLFAR